MLTALFAAGGAFIGAAWYRRDALGGLALIICILLARGSGMAFSTDWGPLGVFYEAFTGDDRIGAVTGVAVRLACIGGRRLVHPYRLS
ncbi:MAG: hypothetical protein GEU80_04985 [Dehalococcoidia bacterium]|nr:hypothetical protein [Dehalococcoidia bacterium]